MDLLLNVKRNKTVHFNVSVYHLSNRSILKYDSDD